MIGKTLFFGLLTLLALAVAAPALTGLYLAREFDDLVARVEQPGFTRVVASDFERGWFKSRATIRLRPDPALCADAPCPAVTLDSIVHHGPISFTAPQTPHGVFAPTLGVAVTRVDPAALWPRLVFDPPLESLQLITRVGFDGKAVSRLAFAAASVDIARSEKLAHVESSILNARLTVPLRGQGMDGELDWPRFRIVGEKAGQFGWRDLAISTRMATTATDAVAGQQLRAESIRMASPAGTSALLEGVIARLQPLPSGGARQLDARVSRLVVKGNEYGPLIVQGRAGDIDIGTWLDVARTAAGGTDRADDTTPYQEMLSQLLVSRPRIDIRRFLLTMPDGDVTGHLSLSPPDEPLPDRPLADLLARYDLDFALVLPETTIRDIVVQVMLNNGWSRFELGEKDVTKALKQLLDRGLIERAGDANDAYRLRLTIDDGRLVLNGRSQPGWQSVVDRFEAARAQL